MRTTVETRRLSKTYLEGDLAINPDMESKAPKPKEVKFKCQEIVIMIRRDLIEGKIEYSKSVAETKESGTRVRHTIYLLLYRIEDLGMDDVPKMFRLIKSLKEEPSGTRSGNGPLLPYQTVKQRERVTVKAGEKFYADLSKTVEDSVDIAGMGAPVKNPKRKAKSSK